MCGDHATKHIERHRGLLIAQTHQDDAGMRSRRMSPDIAEPNVEGDKQPILAHAHREQLLVVDAVQALVGDGVRLVAGLREQSPGDGGDVLVELDLHEPRGRE